MNIGERIQKLRKQSNMTQNELAEKLFVSFQAVSQWENGNTKPDTEILPKIAEILNVSIDQLFYDEIEFKNKVILHNFDEQTLYFLVVKGASLLTVVNYNEVIENKDDVLIKIEGDPLNVVSNFSVSIEGNIEGNATAGDSISCGNVSGNATAGDTINCGNVEGNASGGSSVNCGNIEGNVSAGVQVNCGNIEGNVSSGGDIYCDDINGNVNSGKNLNCDSIEASEVKCNGDLTCDELHADKIEIEGKIITDSTNINIDNKNTKPTNDLKNNDKKSKNRIVINL